MNIKTRLNNLINSCDSFIEKNNKYLEDAVVSKKNHREKIFKNNVSELLSTRKMILSLLNRLKSEPENMLNQINYFNEWFFLSSKLIYNNPEDYFFPFRFFHSSFSAKLYIDVRTIWERNKDIDEVLEFLFKYVKKRKFFEQIKSLFETIDKGSFNKNRSKFVQEIKDNFDKKNYLSSTLVTITQIEGLIWDFAKFINSDEVKIYYEKKSKYYPYIWNEDNQSYFQDNRMLTSVRSLLLKTRLQEIISFDLYSYLISEFYDDRNYLSHGDILNRNLKSDAISSLLCLVAVLRFLAKYDKKNDIYISVKI